MADFFTDNILGNNANPGTAVSPFKTISHAFSVASDNDEIYVAGSATTALPGTATHNDLHLCDTTDDLTALVAVGDVIEFTDSVTGKPFYSSVRSISSTQIGMSSDMTPFDDTTLTLKRVDNVHYIVVSIAPEQLTTLRSGIKMSGGWDSTFTNQIGYTWFVNVNTTGASAGIAMTFTSNFAYNFKLERFGYANIQSPSGSTLSATLNNGTITGDLAMSNCGGGLGGVYTTENQPDLYLFNASVFGSTSRPANTFDLTTGQPSFSVNEVVICSGVRGLATIAAAGHFAVNTFTAVVGHVGQTQPSFLTSILGQLPRTVINSLQIYQLPTSRGSVAILLSRTLTVANFPTHRIKNLDVYGVAAQFSLGSGQNPAALFDITLVGKNLMDIPWTTASAVANSYIGGLIRGQAMIKADDGTAVLRGFQLYQTDSTEFDTGSNSLKWNKKTVDSLNEFPAVGAIDNLMIADFIAETGKTINIRVKLEAPHTAGAIEFVVRCMENTQTVTFDPGIAFFNDTTWVTFSIPLTAVGDLPRVLDRHCQLTLQVANNDIDAGITAIYIDSVEIV